MGYPKVIAFYLPQYHPTPDNDKWWGKGFTEWTNVGKAKPLFKGHYQPKVPADLGYYDLRLPEVREAQAELAREAGIYGFCYYHYWFGNGKRELEMPFNEVLKTGKPDFPFMLCWANESWDRKFWNNEGSALVKETLVEQTYPGEEDIKNHFYELLPAFRDHRYIKIEGKPAFMIYKATQYPEVSNFIKIWNQLAEKEGLSGIYFIAQTQIYIDEIILQDYLNLGFNAVNVVSLYFYKWLYKTKFSIFYKNIIRKQILKQPIFFKYKTAIKYFNSPIDDNPHVFQTIIPNWDHSPRSGKNGYIIHNSNPSIFKLHLDKIFSTIKNKKDPIIFLKSWNEWGEGNYMEPDLRYGKAYIKTLREKLDNLNSNE